MTGFDHDPELPRGFQDADFEMAELQQAANREERLRRKGICAHGWQRGDGKGGVICNHCGQVFATEAEAMAARREALL